MVGKNNGKHGRRRNAMNSMRTSHIPRGLGGRTISLISNGICGLPSSSPCTQGRRTIPGLRWIIWAGWAGVISKLRMRVKMMYFILWDFPGKRCVVRVGRTGQRNSLESTKVVSNARPRTTKEAHDVTPYSWQDLRTRWNVFPALRSEWYQLGTVTTRRRG